MSDDFGTRRRGRKESQFPVKTAVETGSSLTAFVDGLNYSITYANFVTGLGVTGTITTAGAATGTPILNGSSPDYLIRNLEDGSGVMAQVSPENGVTLSHTFVSGTGGVDVLTDETADSPVIRSIAAGEGIAVSASNGSITVSATDAPPTTDIVIVNSVDDLPTPVANVITLEENATYSLQGLIDLGVNRLVVVTGIEIFSENRQTRGFSSDNAGAMMTASDGGAFILRELQLVSTAGKLFDLSAGGSVSFDSIIMFQSAAASTIDAMNTVSFRNCGIVDGGSGVFGFLWSGANGEFNVSESFFQNWTGTLFDFGTATFSRGMIVGGGNRFLTASGATAIDGAASSANFPAGVFGLVYANKFTGLGTYLATITEQDNRWQFTENGGLDETKTDAINRLSANVTATVISTINTPVLVAGTWTVVDNAQTTSTTAGRVTIDTEEAGRLPVDATLNIQMATGGTKTVTAYIAVNGTVVANSGIPIQVSSSPFLHISLLWQQPFELNDFIEIFVENNSDTTNILVSDSILRVN